MRFSSEIKSNRYIRLIMMVTVKIFEPLSAVVKRLHTLEIR
jgi:hypothetical protein